MRLNFRIAKRKVGLDETFEIRSQEQYEFAHKLVVEKIVEARRAGQDQVAAEFSEIKALFKKRLIRMVNRHCPTCGGVKSYGSYECQMCSRITRHYPNAMSMEEPKEFVIESNHLVGPRQLPRAPLTKTLTKMAAEGQVGDSFVVFGKPSTTVKTVARMLGLEIICRKINEPGEKDKKKLQLRVWRSDGLDEEEVNEILRKRMNGEPVPPPKKCVPPSAAEIKEIKAKAKGRPGRPRQDEAA